MNDHAPLYKCMQQIENLRPYLARKVFFDFINKDHESAQLYLYKVSLAAELGFKPAKKIFPNTKTFIPSEDYDWNIYVKALQRQQMVILAIYAAWSVLPIYENAYRPEIANELETRERAARHGQEPRDVLLHLAPRDAITAALDSISRNKLFPYSVVANAEKASSIAHSDSAERAAATAGLAAQVAFDADYNWGVYRTSRAIIFSLKAFRQSEIEQRGYKGVVELIGTKLEEITAIYSKILLKYPLQDIVSKIET